MVKIQARGLLRLATRKNATITGVKGLCKKLGKGTPSDYRYNGVCPVQLLTMHYFDSLPRDHAGVAEKLGLEEEDIKSLEGGFEGWEFYADMKNRYYKVGKRFRQLVELS